jgi:hypothetical protein
MRQTPVCRGTALLLLVCLLGSVQSLGEDQAAQGKGYLLRYQFKKDEVLYYQVDHETTMTTTRPELKETVTNDVRTRKSHRVVSVDSDGTAWIELAIEEARMSAQFGEGEPLCFDSQNPEECPKAYKHVRDIIGKPLAQAHVSPRGELLSTKPLLGAGGSETTKPAKADGSLSDEASRNFLVEFPEHPVKVGESWNNTYKVNVRVGQSLRQPVTLQRSYELVEVADDLATIKLRTALITPIRDGMVLAQLIQMTPEGTMVFDLKNGRMVSRTLTIDKTEVGVIGGSSAMHAKSKREERWIDPKAEKKAG